MDRKCSTRKEIRNLHKILFRKLQGQTPGLNTRAVRKVSVHFEYLENRSNGLDVNLVASQWRPYYASTNSHSPVGLVSRQ